MKTFFKNLLISYLNYWALSTYNRFKPYVIGVTGSSGKTTTKYIISQLLQESGKKTFVSKANLNTRYGLPLAVLLYDEAPSGILAWTIVVLLLPIKSILFKSYPDYLVLEYAADLPGDIKKLTMLIPPDIAVITSVGVAHIEIFKSEASIIAEKLQLAKAAREYAIMPEGVYAKIKPDGVSARIVIAEKVPFLNFENIKYKVNAVDLDIVLDGKKHKLSFAFAGEHNLSNLRLSILASYFSGASSKLIDGVEKLVPLVGRGERFVGRREIMVIDESDNANPESMLAALKNLDNIKYGRKVAVLGEMKEIGPISERSHKEVSRIAKLIADLVIGVGEGFKDCELDKWYPNVRELKGDIESVLQKSDVVLFKGSRSNSLEEAIELLK